VVGSRVVVRRRVPGETGPSGGPAMTDVLGVCLAWGPDVCVIRPESGRPVEIPLGDIVAGKPVPPRASVRQRVSARDTERHSLPMWPQVERLALGEWELRSDPAPVGRLLKRANSCLAIGDPGMPVADAAAEVVSFYELRERDVLAQVVLGSPTEQALTGLGWRSVPGGDSHFLVTSVAMALRIAPPGDEAVLDEDGPRAHVVRRVAGQDIGSARAALDGDWLGIHSLVVDPDHRGQGHASAMTGALLEWAAERGATTVWLHVETDNLPALAMYDKLGFAVHHSCRYLAAPAGRV
jgi:ribosomal protein S18 acetylase RimI-like enzyme